MRAVFEHHARGAAALHGDLLDRPMLVNFGAGGLRGDAQRLRELAVVDLMVLRRKQRAGDLAGKMRLACARVAAAESHSSGRPSWR